LDKFILRRVSAVLMTSVLLAVVVVLVSCGDTYRPIVTPITQPGGDPQATHYAIVINANNGQPTDLNTGIGPSASQFDVSGDTNIGNRRLGLSPVHAVLTSSFEAFVVNHGDNSVSLFTVLQSNPTIATVFLENNADATYVDGVGTTAIVSETALNRVAVVDANLAAVRYFLNVGPSPVAVVVTPNLNKAYVANTGDGTITAISLIDSAVQGSPIVVGGVPTSLAVQNTSTYVFAVNSSGGALSVIDTSSNQEVQRFSGLSNPTKVVWDNSLQRVYVMNRGSNTIGIYNGAAPAIQLLRTVPLSGSPIGIAVLDNGSKFYVLYGGNPGHVDVFNTQSFQRTSTLTVQNNPVSIAAVPGSSKVYVVNQNGDSGSASPQFPNGSVSIIKTSDDTVLNVGTSSVQPVFVTAQ
jgi:DNA-binding beta-propeller fold protein YncE